MKYTPYTVTYTLSKNRAKEFDKFVIGSDQVWNYGDGTISKIMFGLFTNKENIIVTDRIPYEEILNYYDLIDILVIPTIVEEAFGMVAIEGLTLRKQIIYSDSGALPDILNNDIFVKVSLKDDFVNNLGQAIKNECMENKTIDIPLQINGHAEYYENFKDVLK